jgi:hypothetical protein
MARLSAWPRVRKWFRLQAHFDLLFALLERARTPFAYLCWLGQQVRERRRPPFLPGVEDLEPRLVPTSVQFSTPNYPVEQGSDHATLTAVLNAPSSNLVTADYDTSDGSAADGTDYTRVSGQLTFAPGDTQQTIEVPLIYQQGDCGTSFSVWLSDPGGAGLGNPYSAQVTIEPSVGFYNPTFQVQYSDDAANVEVDLSASTSQDVQVAYATGNLSALSGTDYLRSVGILTIPAGNTTGTISVPLLNQPEAADRTFALSLTRPVGAVFGALISDSLTSSTVVIIEPPPSVAFHAAAAQVPYNSTQEVEVDLSYPSDQPIDVNYTMSNGSGVEDANPAHAGTDYTTASGTLHFDACVVTATITVNTLGPVGADGGRDFTLTLSNPTNATLGSLTSEVLTLVPTVRFRSTAQQVAYGTSTTIYVDLSCPSTQAIEVSYGTSNGTAAGGHDFVSVGGARTIAPSATSTSFTLDTLTPSQTGVKSFTLWLASPSNALLGAASETITVGVPSPSYRLAPHLQVNISDGDYTGSPFVASATVAGLLVGDRPGASLEGVTPDVSYYDSTGTQLTGPPTDAGTYTAKVSFGGSSDYAPVPVGSTPASTTFTIRKTVPVLTLTADGGTEDGSTAFPASFALFDAAGTHQTDLGGQTITLTYYLDGSTQPLSGAPTAAGIYTVTASFPGTANYAPLLRRAALTV